MSIIANVIIFLLVLFAGLAIGKYGYEKGCKDTKELILKYGIYFSKNGKTINISDGGE